MQQPVAVHVVTASRNARAASPAVQTSVTTHILSYMHHHSRIASSAQLTTPPHFSTPPHLATSPHLRRPNSMGAGLVPLLHTPLTSAPNVPSVESVCLDLHAAEQTFSMEAGDLDRVQAQCTHPYKEGEVNSSTATSPATPGRVGGPEYPDDQRSSRPLSKHARTHARTRTLLVSFSPTPSRHSPPPALPLMPSLLQPQACAANGSNGGSAMAVCLDTSEDDLAELADTISWCVESHPEQDQLVPDTDTWPQAKHLHLHLHQHQAVAPPLAGASSTFPPVPSEPATTTATQHTHATTRHVCTLGQQHSTHVHQTLSVPNMRQQQHRHSLPDISMDFDTGLQHQHQTQLLQEQRPVVATVNVMRVAQQQRMTALRRARHSHPQLDHTSAATTALTSRHYSYTRAPSLPLTPSPIRGKDERVFACYFAGCGKVYRKKGLYQAHIRGHTGERPYVCQAPGCTSRFVRSDELSRHTRKHTGVKPHGCNTCGRKFARKDHLDVHVKIHERAEKKAKEQARCSNP